MLARYLLPAAAALLGLTNAQVHTDCNPMERDDCPDNPGLGTDHEWQFNSTPNGQLWETVVGPIDYSEEDGARFTIGKQGDSPTLRTKFYFFFGRVEFHLKAASGQGIVSSMMLLSDNLDEIDWEFIGTNTSHGSTNFFGKGLEDYTNGEWHEVPVGPQDDFHNYTTIWTAEKMDFFIDGQQVRTIVPADARFNDTDTYPQTPMRMSLGIWAGGDPSLNEWTREWAGGDTNFDEGPFDMYVKSARIEDYGSGKEYVWGDRSGTWESIEIVEGNSTAVEVINDKSEPEKSVGEKFNELPQGAKIAIYAGSGTVGALLIGALIFYCIKQRRRGAGEARLAEERANNERMELAGMRKAGIDPDGFTEHGHEYDAREMSKGGSTYTALNDGPNDFEEKGWGGAAGAGAGIAAGGALGVAARNPNNPFNSPNPSYQDLPMSPRSPPGSPGFPAAAVGASVSRTGSPMSRMGSPGPAQPYGAHRMQQQNSGNRSFSDNHYPQPPSRSNSGPSPMGPGGSRSFSENPNRMHNNSPGAWSGYRQ